MKKGNKGFTVIIVTECPYSGVLRSIIEHSKLFLKLGFKIYFVVPSIARDRYGEHLKLNKSILAKFGVVLSTPLRRNYGSLRSDKLELSKLIANYDNFIVLSYAGYAGKICRLLYRDGKIPFLYHVPQCVDIIRRPIWQQPIESLFEYYLARFASFYIACSKSERNILESKYKIKNEKIITITNYILRESEVVNSKRDLLFVILGRLSADKRVGDILKIGKKLNLLKKSL
jgi:glycosyltransferase involved in cell wall biosynthesis